ncbi:protein D2 [Drosophila mojavensis]|uniref:Uncharacterized protein n=1 Tax=Drosophila mojavensis TaxID=7230 RepID=B4KBP0_DROMO|nr:protein D2 [Drosophila mojavensis]EDW14717.1 uncharacterized protein Dmoj_GI24414 [Drosophila mojavensis]
MLLQSVALVCVLAAVQCNPETDAFKWQGVVPDVVAQPPNQMLKITYDDRLMIMNGAIVTPSQVKNTPTVEWPAEPESYYTLAMVDPDAPSRASPKLREFKHWLVVNIPGNNVAQGDALAEYVGAGPPKDTGLHRYVFLVYAQPKKLVFSGNRVSNKSRRSRTKFHIKQFAEHHRLGQPIAGTFFMAEYDEYVPILSKQLSGH